MQKEKNLNVLTVETFGPTDINKLLKSLESIVSSDDLGPVKAVHFQSQLQELAKILQTTQGQLVKERQRVDWLEKLLNVSDKVYFVRNLL